MNDKYDNLPFIREVRDLFWRMPVMTAQQFIKTMTYYSGLTGEDLEYLIRPYLLHGVVLMSENGYATVKENLDVVAKELGKVSKDGEIRIEKLVPFGKYRRFIDCYNILMEFFPKSENFILTKNLFQAEFVDEEKSLIYQIVRVPVNKENLYKLLFKKESMAYSYGSGLTLKDSLRRIAIVENDACVEDIPYCGFTRICVADPSEKRGFRLAEKRKDDIWKDMIRDNSSAG